MISLIKVKVSQGDKDSETRENTRLDGKKSSAEPCTLQPAVAQDWSLDELNKQSIHADRNDPEEEDTHFSVTGGQILQ